MHKNIFANDAPFFDFIPISFRLKHYIRLIVNLKKGEMHLLFLIEFKRSRNASQTVADINRPWGDGYTCDQKAVQLLILKALQHVHLQLAMKI